MNFSVAICVYAGDSAKYFTEALNSLVHQTVLPSEIVLVADGPLTLELESVIQDFQQRYKNLKPIYLKENVGHGKARNVAIQNCSYDLIAIMDADDICHRHRFEKELKCFEEDCALSIVGTHISEFLGSIENIVGVRSVPSEDKEIKEYLKKRCPFNQVTVMFKKEAVLQAGGYLDWYCNEDYYLWIRMFKIGCKFKNITEPLVYVRVDQNMYKRRGGWDYFVSEARLQHYMLDCGIVSHGRCYGNIVLRFIVQIAMPNSLRGWIYKVFAREKK